MTTAPGTSLHNIFRIIADVLTPAGIECLLVGGFAVNAYGYSRATLDVDLMIVYTQRDQIRAIVRREGFSNISVHESVMFAQEPESPWRVDFLQVDPDTMSELLSQAKLHEIEGKIVKIPALRDLIAMKLFSLSQNPTRRTAKDLPDIAHLILLHNLDLECDIRPLAERFATENIFNMVTEQVEALRK